MTDVHRKTKVQHRPGLHVWLHLGVVHARGDLIDALQPNAPTQPQTQLYKWWKRPTYSQSTP